MSMRGLRESRPTAAERDAATAHGVTSRLQLARRSSTTRRRNRSARARTRRFSARATRRFSTIVLRPCFLAPATKRGRTEGARRGVTSTAHTPGRPREGPVAGEECECAAAGATATAASATAKRSTPRGKIDAASTIGPEMDRPAETCCHPPFEGWGSSRAHATRPIGRAGTPATVVPRSTSCLTTAPAPITAPSPIVTPPRITAPDPSDAPRQTRVI